MLLRATSGATSRRPTGDLRLSGLLAPINARKHTQFTYKLLLIKENHEKNINCMVNKNRPPDARRPTPEKLVVRFNITRIRSGMDDPSHLKDTPMDLPYNP